MKYNVIICKTNNHEIFLFSQERMDDVVQFAKNQENFCSVTIPSQWLVILQSYDETTEKINVYTLTYQDNGFYGTVYIGVKPKEKMNFAKICKLIEETNGAKVSMEQLEIYKLYESGRVLFLD